jgi:hypothetical protein
VPQFLPTVATIFPIWRLPPEFVRQQKPYDVFPPTFQPEAPPHTFDETIDMLVLRYGLKKIVNEAVESAMASAAQIGRGAGRWVFKGLDVFTNPDPLGQGEEARIREQLQALGEERQALFAALRMAGVGWRLAWLLTTGVGQPDVTLADP